MKVKLILDLLGASHETGEDSETHLGVGLYEVLGQSVHSCTNLTRHGDSILGVS